MKGKILIFGGTTEGRELADSLKKLGIPHIVSVATEYGEEILRKSGEENVLVGRKSSEEIEKLIESESFAAVVDATHPFATEATKQIKSACENANVNYMRLSRNTSSSCANYKGIKQVDSLDEAIELLKNEKGNILILTGSKEIEKIAEGMTSTSGLYARVLPNEESLKKCVAAGLSGKQIIAMQGPFSKAMNKALIREVNASVILTKESGKTGGLDEKLQAAAECNVKAIVIRNPESCSDVKEGPGFEAVLEKICELTGTSNTASVAQMERFITLAGIGPGKECYFTKELENALSEADIIFGAKSVARRVMTDDRKVPVIFEYDGEKLFKYLEEHPEYHNPVAVFSGDISLCSGAKGVLKSFEERGYKIRKIAGISSVTLFAKNLGIGLEETRIISAHGRECNIAGYVRREKNLIILPSGILHAGQICREIIGADAEIVIGYELGTDMERLIAIASEEDINELEKLEGGKCLIYVKNREAGKIAVIPGIRDREILRGKAPMTKEEVRALSIRKLELTPDAVFFDIGAGTGSISLEASLLHPGIRVYSIEMKDEAVGLLRQNKEKFKISNMTIVQGKAPETLLDLPSPTHAFIGGSSGNLREILKTLFDKNELVRVVINCVTLETMSEILQISGELEDQGEGYKSEVIQVGITDYKKVGQYTLADAKNPVYIVTIQKECVND